MSPLLFVLINLLTVTPKKLFSFLLSTPIRYNLDPSSAFPFNFPKGSLDTGCIGYKVISFSKNKKKSYHLL